MLTIGELIKADRGNLSAKNYCKKIEVKTGKTINHKSISDWERGEHLISRTRFDYFIEYWVINGFPKGLSEEIVNAIYEAEENGQPYIPPPRVLEIPNAISIRRLKLGNAEFNWLDKDGKGHGAFKPIDLSVLVEDGEIEIPASYNLVVAQAEREIANDDSKHDGPIFALSDISVGRTSIGENSVIKMKFKETLYRYFYATKKIPIGMKLMMDEIQNWTIEQPPIEHLATGFGCALVIFSSDGKILFTKRGDTAVRPFEYDVSVVEGMHPEADKPYKQRVDLWAMCQRGIKEEFGIETDKKKINLVSLGVDMDYYQWNVVGHIDSKYTYDQLIDAASSRAKDGSFEHSCFIPIDAHPISAFQFIKTRPMWASGVAALVYSLCHKFGHEEVFEAADKVFNE